MHIRLVQQFCERVASLQSVSLPNMSALAVRNRNVIQQLQYCGIGRMSWHRVHTIQTAAQRTLNEHMHRVSGTTCAAADCQWNDDAVTGNMHQVSGTACAAADCEKNDDAVTGMSRV